MLAWCSISVSTTTSPDPRFAAPHVRATRLIASVALRVNTSSCGSAAPMKRAVRARPASNAAVASSASV